MRIDYKTLKPTDMVYFDGPDAFKSLEEAQARFEAYWNALTPEQKAQERIEAQQRIEARKAAGEYYDYDTWPLRPVSGTVHADAA